MQSNIQVAGVRSEVEGLLTSTGCGAEFRPSPHEVFRNNHVCVWEGRLLLRGQPGPPFPNGPTFRLVAWIRHLPRTPWLEA